MSTRVVVGVSKPLHAEQAAAAAPRPSRAPRRARAPQHDYVDYESASSDLPSGRDVELQPNEVAYDGELNALGQCEGLGRATFGKDGAVYDGQFAGGLMEGDGTVNFADGSTYEGTWRMGAQIGDGIFRSPDGVTYEASWLKRKSAAAPQRVWRMVDSDASALTTSPPPSEAKSIWQAEEWLKEVRALDAALAPDLDGLAPIAYGYEGARSTTGEREGRGRAQWPNGDTYVGEWDANQPDGHGVYTTTAGERYDGEWRRGEKSGIGHYKFLADTAGGDEDQFNVYRGEWRHGMRDGRGHMELADGSTYDGQFKGGKREGWGTQRAALKRGQHQRALYRGEFFNGMKQGRGTHRFTVGSTQLSLHHRDHPVGVGVRLSADRQQAVRVINGSPDAAITLEEARELAAALGMSIST